jgi:acyl phosphate:glycerol-3-phosphate acyltransferase
VALFVFNVPVPYFLNMIITISIAILSFLVGSIPFAYILVKRKHNKDLRKEGSRNIGTLNAYEVSGSKGTGKLVLALDVCKGILPVLLVYIILGDSFFNASTAMVFTVLGHNFTPWLRFKGGRGLAPAAGAMLLFNPLLVVVWLISWYVTYQISKNVHIGNIIATIAMPLAAWIIPSYLAVGNVHQPPTSYAFGIAVTLLAAVIFVKHLGPLRDLLLKAN